jgi:hypothetical protein
MSIICSDIHDSHLIENGILSGTPCILGYVGLTEKNDDIYLIC